MDEGKTIRGIKTRICLLELTIANICWGFCCFILDNGALTLLWKALDSSSFYLGGPCFASEIKKQAGKGMLLV